MAPVHWWLDLLAIAALLAVALASRRAQGHWLAPGPFFSAAWAVFAALPLLFVADIDVWPGGVWWIVIASVVVFGSSTAGMAISAKLTALDRLRFDAAPQYPAMRVLIIASSVLGLGVIVSILRDKGIGLSGLDSPSAIAHTERVFSVARYLQNYQEPAVARLLEVAIYFASLLAGLLLAGRAGSKRRWIAAFPLIPAAAVTLVMTERAAIAYPLLLMTGSYLSARAWGDDRARGLLRPKSIIWFCLGTVGLFVLFISVLMGRYGYSNGAQALSILTTFRLDALGYLAAFSDWFHRSALANSHLSFGGFTFAGAFDLLHLRPRTPGIYTDNVVLNGRPTNIFTVFRGLIQDFGLLGSMVFLFMIGLVAGIVYGEASRRNVIAIGLLSAFYATTLWSPIVDLFAYNSILGAWILFMLYLSLTAIRARSGLVRFPSPAPARIVSDRAL